MSDVREADVDTAVTVQGGLVVTGIAGVVLAGMQLVTAIGHVLALGVGGDPANHPASSAGPSAGQALRAAGLASSNLALACICLVSVAVAVRHARAGRVPWVGLGVVSVVAGLTFGGLTWHGDSI